MTKPLGPSVQANLNAADQSPAWDQVDLGLMRDQIEALRSAYPMADLRIAQFLMEIAMGLEDVLKTPDDKLRTQLTGYQVSLTLLASGVSRARRGKPEI